MKQTVADAKARMEQCVREHEQLSNDLRQQYSDKEVRLQQSLRK